MLSNHGSGSQLLMVPRTPRSRQGDYLADGQVRLTKEDEYALRDQGRSARSSLSLAANSGDGGASASL